MNSGALLYQDNNNKRYSNRSITVRVVQDEVDLGPLFLKLLLSSVGGGVGAFLLYGLRRRQASVYRMLLGMMAGAGSQVLV